MPKILIILLNLLLIACQTSQAVVSAPLDNSGELQLDKAEILKLEEEQRILWDEMGK